EMFVDLQNRFDFAALFISHDLAVVDMLSDRIGVLFQGELLEEGTGEQVLGEPEADYTKRPIAALPVPDPAEQAQRRGAARSVRSAAGGGREPPAAGPRRRAGLRAVVGWAACGLWSPRRGESAK